MISIGSSDGKKALGMRYGVGGGEMESETELEEGEACFQNINGDDSAIDPDVALSYIDEKLQDVLGHFQKDFEGGVSAENLGAKFGGYGSFLPTYQRSPVGPHSRTPPNSNNLEGDRQYSASQSSVSQSARNGPASISAASMAAHKGPSMDDKVKQVHTSSARCDDKFTSNGPQPVNNFADTSDQKNLKVQIKVGSDNSWYKKKSEIYSGLGLEDSPSSSIEASPIDSDEVFHKSLDGLDESPTSILEMMTSFPVHESLLLSPLPYDLLFLTKKEKWEESSHIPMHKGGSQKSTLTVGSDSGKVNRNVLQETNRKSSEKNSTSLESTDCNDIHNGVGDIERKENELTNMVYEEFVSNASRISNLFNTRSNIVDFGNGASFKSGPKDGLSDVEKEEPLNTVLTLDDRGVGKFNEKDGANEKILQDNKAHSDEKISVFPKIADSDVSKGSRILDIGLVKPPNQKTAQKATSHKKDSMKLAPDTEASTSGGKKKSKESQISENGSQNVGASKGSSKNESFSTSKGGNGAYGSKSYMEDLKKSNGKARETYKDFFGEVDIENEDEDDMGLEEKPSGNRLKDSVVTEKGTMESQSSSKVNGKKPHKPSSSVHIDPTMGNWPVSDATVATIAPVVKEYWVCCDKCEKWRLLPPGVYPGSLPEKWICSMLDWLPGMNRCSISEEETTKAMTSSFPAPAPVIQCFQPINPNNPQSGVILDDGVKKKNGTKDPSYETKKDKPSLSSNSTKKNLSTSYKSRSLNGTNQSPLFNEVEFQDSGHSGSLIADKHKPKQKEKKKVGDDFVNEGDNLQLKIRNHRETSQDYARDAKKVKIDHNGAVFKGSHSSNYGCPNDSKSASKVSVQNPKDQNQGNSFEKDVAKKRKSYEFEGMQTDLEETSETERRKEKKARAPKSRAEERGINVKSEQLMSVDVVDSSKRDMAPVEASMAATSSSSKVSGSHKTKSNNQEAKGSPVESVSSSPLRILNLDKLTSSRRNIQGVDDLSGHKGIQYEHGEGTSAHGHNEECQNDNLSHPKKRSKDKNRSSRPDIGKVNLKIAEPMKENLDIPSYEKGRRNKSQEKPLVYSDNLEKGHGSKKELSGKPLMESAKRDGQSKHGLHERDGGRSSKMDVSGKGKLYSLPPSGKCQNEMARSQKEIAGNTLSIDAGEKTDAVKTSKQNMKAESKNGNQPSNMRHATPNRYKGRDHDAPSPLRRESSNQAATNAVKEAKDLKHLADRLKNSGSNLESTALYFQAVLKFLHGASLLESNNGDMSQSTAIYSSTAKLCEFCAHEYEKSKEMAAAALAYKCMEVAYFKVVYLSHTSACKDRHELQASLQLGPTGESPSSSGSDLDNLNNPDKAALAKGVNSTQVAGNHFIPARNKPNFVRLLNYAQDINFAMEASRRTRIAFAASSSKLEEAHHKEGISAVKKALDFNFQDAEGLLRLVRLAMEVISR